MVLTSGQILFFLSGGAANSNPLESKGGQISNSVILPDDFNTVFDDITAVENSEGTLEHRALYVKNGGSDMLRAARIYFGFSDNFVSMGLTSRSAGETEDSIPSEDALPGAGSDGSGGTPVVDPSEWNIMYQHPETMPSVFSLNDINKRVGMYNFGVRSAAYNRRQDRLDVWLHKSGSPTGPITATIRNIKKGADTVVATYNTTYEASTLTTAPTRKSFVMSPDRKYTPDVSDITSIEYANGSSSNNVRISMTNHPNTPALFEWQVASFTSGKWQVVSPSSIQQAEIFTSTCGMASPGGGGVSDPVTPVEPPISFTGFTRPTNYENGLLLGDIPAGSYRGFWLQRSMKPNQRPSQNMVFQILVKGGNS